MATQNNLNVGINVTDNGTTNKVIKSVGQLNSALHEANKTAAQFSLGGTRGSRGVAAKAAPSGSQAMTEQSYNSMRGSAGVTGASARDFANQAQGLGGLVRLYATYAANVFAVSAAFNALKSAADTTNLIKGLDQLGVKSGQALGTLAQRLVEVTDGAVSMREAMEATAKASSSGMNTDQILRMGKAAKQASQALGVDMSDAMSRISRGITKLEPELLDELGLFVRIDKVVEDYAKSVGKSALQITDFEKRMAFANAVLDQSEKKFSAINLDANPYNKLSAAVKNLTQSGLELVNTFLTPVIGLLSSSPTSLGLVIAGIGTMLLKQAIPAFGQYREHLSKAAQESSNTVTKIFLEQQRVLAEGDLQASERASAAFKSSKKVIAEVNALQSSAIQFSNTAKTKWNELAAKSPFDLTDKELRSLDARAKRLEASNKAESDALKGHLADIRRIRQEHEDAQVAAQKKFEKSTSGLGSSQGQTEILANRALRSASADSIRSIVSEKQAIYGATEAWKTLNAEIAKSRSGTRTVDVFDAQGNVIEKKLVPATGALQNGWMRASGAIGIATGALSKFLSVAQPWLIVIGLAVEAFAILDDKLSKNKKQQQDFSDSITRSSKAVEMLYATMLDISNKPFGEQFNTESLNAASNAINETSASVTKLTADVLMVQKAQGGWDRFIDSIKSAWGGDVKSKFAETMSKTVVGALQELAGSPAAKDARKRLSELLNIDSNFTMSEFEEAIKKVSSNKPLLKQVSDTVIGLGSSVGNLADKSRNLDTAFTDSKTALRNLQNQFKVTDTLALFGESVVTVGQTMAKAFQDPELAISQLAQTVQDTSRLSLFNEEDRTKLLSYTDNIVALNKRYEEQKAKVQESTKEIEKQEAILRDFRKSRGLRDDKEIKINQGTVDTDNAITKLAKLRGELAQQQADLSKTGQEVNSIVAEFPSLATAQLERGAGFISAGITAAFAKGADALQSAAAGILGDLPGVAEVQKDIANKQIDAQTALLQAQRELIKVQRENTVAVQIATVKKDLENAEALKRESRGTANNEATIAAYNKKLAELEKMQSIVQMDPKQAKSAIDSVVAEAKRGNAEVSTQAASLMNDIVASAGINAQITSQFEQKKVNDLNAQVKSLAEQNKIKQDGLVRDSKAQDLVLEGLSLQEKINGTLSAGQIYAEGAAKAKKIENDAQKSINDLKLKEDTLNKANNILGKDSKGFAERKAEIEKLAGDQKQINQDKINKLADIEYQTAQKVLKTTLTQLEKQKELADLRKQAPRTREDTEFKKREIDISTNRDTSKFTEAYQRSTEDRLSMDKKVLEAQRANEDEISSYRLKSQELYAQQIAAFESDASAAEQQRIADKISATDAAHRARLAQIEEVKNKEISSIDEVAAYREKRETVDSNIEALKSMDSAWQGVGTAIANVYQSLDSFNTLQKQNSISIADSDARLSKLYDSAAEGKDVYADISKEEEKNAKLKSKATKDELAGNIKVLSSAKGLFKEKTAAYKLISATEKAMHLYRMAMFVKEAAQEIWAMGRSVYASVTKMGAKTAEAGVDGVAAVVKAIASVPFPLNIAAGAITAAAVAALLSKIGGGTVSAPSGSYGGFVPSSDQLKETQGTGQTWDSAGNKVADAGGVLGMPEEKANSIVNSLEILRDNSFGSLSYDQKLLRSFEKVSQTITGVTTSFVTSGMAMLPKALSAALGSFSSKKSGLLGSIANLWGSSSSSTSLYSQRLELSGNFEQATNSVNETLKNIATTFTQWSSSSWFGLSKSSGSYYQDTLLPLAKDVTDSFSMMLGGLKTSYIEIAKLTGKTSTEAASYVAQTLSNVQFKDSEGKPLKFEYKGLSATDMEKELTAFMSKINNLALDALFPQFAEFKKIGEDYGTTVIKVLHGNAQVNAALKSMGSTFDVTKDKVEQVTETFDFGIFGLGSFTLSWNKTITKFQMSETIINDMAGSLENFTDQAQYFIDNFLTESERVNNIRDTVTKALADLNLPLDLTREQFKLIVQSMDLSTQTGRDMYQGLMDIAPEFIKVTQRLEDLKKTTSSLEIELLKAQGNTDAATAAVRALDTEGMTPAELAAYNYNQTLQDQIDALKQADAVTKERIGLEQRLYQASNNIVALRAVELDKLDESNRAIQLQVWAYEDFTKVLNTAKAAIDAAAQSIKSAEDAIVGIQAKATDNYIAATQKVADAQQNIANLAIEAAKKMSEFGKSLRNFIGEQLTPNTSKSNANTAFLSGVKNALAGDTTAIQSIPELAQQAIDAAKASARSSQEFASTKGAILGKVTDVAKFAEAQASLVNIPAEEDPLVAANKALEDALKEQTAALLVANSIGASLVKTPEDLIQQYKDANQDLATAIVEKALAEEAQRRAQAALDAIAFNTGKLITGITGASTETAALAKVVETELNSGFGALDSNLDGKLTYAELVKGLNGKATDKQITNLIDAVDLNRDTVISSYELELFNSTKSIVEALGEGFNLLDTNLDGKLSIEEFKAGMEGKASDAVLDSIFKLVDGDNDKLLSSSEAIAADSALNAAYSANISSNTGTTANNVAVQALAVATGADQTADALSVLNTGNLTTIATNTAVTVNAINALLSSNSALAVSLASVVANTKALADAVNSGSGTGTTGSTSSGTNVFKSVLGIATGIVGGVVDAVGSIVEDIGDFFGGLFSDRRTKKDITLAERLSNGINLYDYSYKEPYASIYGKGRKRGVMAQEVMHDYPSAVSKAANGMYMVDYSKLPIPSNKLKLAAGGVFTNDIIAKPTYFDLGQMGEAGPEAVMPLTRTSSGRLGVVSTGDNTTANEALIAEIRQLKEEVSLLRHEARATAVASTKTTRILQRVTQNGDSLLTTDAATV